MIVTPPTIDVILENSVVLSCVSQGEPTPDVVWRLPDNSNVDSKSGRVTSEGTLPIDNAMVTDAGLYICEATNELGIANGTSMVTVRGNYSSTKLVQSSLAQPAKSSLARPAGPV